MTYSLSVVLLANRSHAEILELNVTAGNDTFTVSLYFLPEAILTWARFRVEESYSRVIVDRFSGQVLINNCGLDKVLAFILLHL